MKKFVSKHAFWIFQILGCAAITLFVYFVAKISGGIYEQLLFLMSVFLGYFIPTIILRYLYKWFVNTTPFKTIDFLKIVLFLIVIVILGKELPYYLGYLAGRVADIFGLYQELKSEIKPPKNWSILQYAAPLIVYTGWTFFYFIIKEFRKYIASKIARSKLKDEIKQAQLNTLKGHLNPQFMVASLRTIKELMLSDVPLARKLLTKLSETLRYSLTKNNINSVSLQEEIEVAQNYIALLNIDDKDKFQIVYDIDPETYLYEVPPMLLMSLTEIATKHGILQLKEGGKAVLVSKLLNPGLEIRVTHSGKITRSKETEVLENTIKQRLRLLFEGKARFSAEHELNTTTLIVNMPLAAS